MSVLPPLSQTSITVSTVLPARAEEVWPVLRVFTSLGSWLEGWQSVMVEGAPEGHVGALRRVSQNEVGFVEQLDCLDDDAFVIKWKVVSHPTNQNPFPGSYLDSSQRMRLHRVTLLGQTFIEWSHTFSTEATCLEVMRDSMVERMEAGLRGLGALLQTNLQHSGSLHSKAAAAPPLSAPPPAPSNHPSEPGKLHAPEFAAAAGAAGLPAPALRSTGLALPRSQAPAASAPPALASVPGIPAVAAAAVPAAPLVPGLAAAGIPAGVPPGVLPAGVPAGLPLAAAALPGALPADSPAAAAALASNLNPLATQQAQQAQQQALLNNAVAEAILSGTQPPALLNPAALVGAPALGPLGISQPLGVPPLSVPPALNPLMGAGVAAVAPQAPVPPAPPSFAGLGPAGPLGAPGGLAPGGLDPRLVSAAMQQPPGALAGLSQAPLGLHPLSLAPLGVPHPLQQRRPTSHAPGFAGAVSGGGFSAASPPYTPKGQPLGGDGPGGAGGSPWKSFESLPSRRSTGSVRAFPPGSSPLDAVAASRQLTEAAAVAARSLATGAQVPPETCAELGSAAQQLAQALPRGSGAPPAHPTQLLTSAVQQQLQLQAQHLPPQQLAAQLAQASLALGPLGASLPPGGIPLGALAPASLPPGGIPLGGGGLPPASLPSGGTPLGGPPAVTSLPHVPQPLGGPSALEKQPSLQGQQQAQLQPTGGLPGGVPPPLGGRGGPVQPMGAGAVPPGGGGMPLSVAQQVTAAQQAQQAQLAQQLAASAQQAVPGLAAHQQAVASAALATQVVQQAQQAQQAQQVVQQAQQAQVAASFAHHQQLAAIQQHEGTMMLQHQRQRHQQQQQQQRQQQQQQQRLDEDQVKLRQQQLLEYQAQQRQVALGEVQRAQQGPPGGLSGQGGAGTEAASVRSEEQPGSIHTFDPTADPAPPGGAGSQPPEGAPSGRRRASTDGGPG